ncbi:PAS domain S-box protein [Shumkonia mesophila]|uniref:PAS domain S-box protein n=1 Tax=Shumkonia mesophila TaxID=2838854 RepID=UPI002934B9EF|nr:PAS domain S-box protein [Shumkonia mesophila]
MEMGQSFAFLGAFVASAVLAIVLAYIAKITGLRTALNLWSLGYALNAARLLVYAVAGISPPQAMPFLLAEGLQALQSLALLFGVLIFAGRPVSLVRHVLPAALGALLLLALMAAVGDDGLLRVAPSYAVSAACLLLAGGEVARSRRREGNTGFTFTAVVLILWGLHKLDFLLLTGGAVEIAQFRFMASAGFYTAAALGFAIMALTVFHHRLSRSQAENEAHFRKMFEDAPVGYQSLDEEGRVVAVNRRWLDILGYAQDEVIGRSFVDFLTPASRARFPLRFAQFKAAGVAKEVEFELLRKDGREILGVFDGRINPGAKPGVIRTHCVMTDVTEKRRKEALVTRLGRIIEQSFNEIFVFDAETLKILHVNKGGIANIGYSLEELRRLTPLDIEPDFTRERFEALVAPLRSGEQDTLLFEARHRRKDGTTYDVETRLQLMAEEVPPVFAAVARDITARKQAETALREREGLLQGVMDHSPSSIYVKDPDGRFILVNREFERRNRIAAAEAMGKTSHDLQPAKQADDSVRRERLARDDGKVYVEEIEVDFPEGKRAFLSAKFPVFDAAGKFMGTGSVSTDITANKKTERALRESEARLKAIMDHSPAAIALRDKDGRFLVANREYLRRSNLTSQDVLGRTLREVKPVEFCNLVETQEREVLTSGEAKLFQMQQKGGDTEATLALVRFPVRDADGAISAVGVVSLDITEWRRTEEALRLSESRLQAIMDHAPAEITHKDREGHYLLANNAYLRRKGVAAEDVLGKTIFDFTSADEAREIRSQDEEVMATGRARNYQGVRRLASGGEGTFAIVRFPLFDDRGEVASVGVIGIDVTREKQAELALRDNEERLRLVLNSTGEGIYAVDLAGCCTLCNPAAARILGYDDPDDLLGRDIHAMIHHSHADGQPYPLAECRAHRAIASKAPVYVDDEVFWRRDGRAIPVAFRSNPVVRNGEVVGTVVSFSDIGERKRAEAWLLRLSQSVEQSPFGIAIADAEGRFEYVNPSYCRETGYTFAEIAGKAMSTQNADGPGSVSGQEISSTLAGGGVWRGEVRHRRRNGEAYWVSLLVSPIRDRNGRTVAYVAISEDITERRRMAEHLRQVQKMEAVGQLTGGVAHDFNNILSVILTSAECLADDLEGEAEIMPLVTTIVRSVHRGADLTQRLLAFSRRQDLNPEILDLSSVMGEMVELLRRSLGETIAISVEAAPGVPPVIVDRGQFENALLNLALNARDAMPEGGALTIGIAPGEPPVSVGAARGGRKGRFVCVSVQDGGTGMAPDVLERVFEPFFTTKGKGQGTGLGLSMVYGFVKQSGGDIVVDSVENAGTTFRLYFPAAGNAVPEPAARPGGGTPEETPLPPLSIVLAEDDAGVRTATKFILESAGHAVFDAVNGLAALDILKRMPKVDLLVTDVVMPGGLSGRDLAEEAWRLIPSLKILFTSGYADGYLSAGDIVAGISTFVPKPYTKEILIGAIRSLGFGGLPNISPEGDG